MIHTPLHFVNFCPIVVSQWLSLSMTTTTNVLNELLKSNRIKALSWTVLSDVKRSVSKHRWCESSSWYSARKAWTQPPKELVDVSFQIRGEADLQLRQSTSVDIHNDVHVGNGGTAAGNTTRENIFSNKVHYIWYIKCQRLWMILWYYEHLHTRYSYFHSIRVLSYIWWQ